LVGHLLSLSGEPVVVGLDFAFSFPAWYVRERGWTAVREVWSAIADEGELLLDEERDPFWGRSSGQGVPEERRLRATERETGEAAGFRPSPCSRSAVPGRWARDSDLGVPDTAKRAIWVFFWNTQMTHFSKSARKC